ncbi:hypothetical protein TRFO_38437 [Tritrichomonas foetus]|uniref:Uncharacterized protein n=1 Tax=Tritrichomonas foetus TaxID=1144522 RepID=A0A1J4JCU2_9EUKA|nr:hypothetical protein TRFO_38437 [Tritrichomonas foetus]|eukprot:OHS95483.1 hypothetical protein TRFO_38437 [Tritrichomonas foetus]
MMCQLPFSLKTFRTKPKILFSKYICPKNFLKEMNSMKRSRKSIEPSTELNDSHTFQKAIRNLKKQIDTDFYLTRHSINYFRALISAIETKGNNLLSEKSRDTKSFFSSWEELKETQLTLCQRPFIEIAVSYVKEHLKACYKTIFSLIEEREDISHEFHVTTQKIDELFLSLKEEVAKLAEKANSMNENDYDNDNYSYDEEGNYKTRKQSKKNHSNKNNLDITSINQLGMKFQKFSGLLHGKFSVVFKSPQYDKGTQKDHELEATFHLDLCANCLFPDPSKHFNPWEGDHLKAWEKLILQNDQIFNSIFKTNNRFKHHSRRHSDRLSERVLAEMNNSNNNFNNSIINNSNSNGNFRLSPDRYSSDRLKEKTQNIPKQRSRDRNLNKNPKNGNKYKDIEKDYISDYNSGNSENEQEDFPPISYQQQQQLFTENNISQPMKINMSDDNNENDNDYLDENEKLISKLRKQIKSLKSKLETETKRADQNEARLRAFGEDEVNFVNIQKENAILKDENVTLKTKVDELKTDNKKFQSLLTIKGKEELDQTIKNENSKLLKENEKLRIEIAKIRSNFVQYKENNQTNYKMAQIKNSTEIQENYLTLQKQIEELQEDNLKMNQKVERKNKYKQDFLTSSHLTENLHSKINEQRNLIDTKQKAIEQLQLIIEELKTKQKQILAQQSHFSTSLHSTGISSIENARSIITRISNEKIKKEEEIRQLKQKLSTEENSKDVLNMQIKTLRISESSLQEEVSRRDKQIKELNKLLEEKNLSLKELNSTKKELEQAQIENQEMVVSLKEIKENMNLLSDKNKELKIFEEKFKEANKIIVKLKNKKKIFKDQIQAKDSQIQMLRNSLNKAVQDTDI